jgi:hypothetical protein
VAVGAAGQVDTEGRKMVVAAYRPCKTWTGQGRHRSFVRTEERAVGSKRKEGRQRQQVQVGAEAELVPPGQSRHAINRVEM